MRIDNRVSHNIVVLEPRERLTVETEPAFAHHFIGLLEAGYTQFALNLADVPYIDSVGLGAIVRAYTSARRRHGDLKLLNVKDRNRYLLKITKLLTVFDCYDSEAELTLAVGRPGLAGGPIADGST